MLPCLFIYTPAHSITAQKSLTPPRDKLSFEYELYYVTLYRFASYFARLVCHQPGDFCRFRYYGERCQFDRYCKLVLYHEALDYLREMQRRRDRETSFDALSQVEMDKLCTENHYPSDSYVFSSHGYDLMIDNELVADAFSCLSKDAQSILILRCVRDMTD